MKFLQNIKLLNISGEAEKRLFNLLSKTILRQKNSIFNLQTELII